MNMGIGMELEYHDDKPSTQRFDHNESWKHGFKKIRILVPSDTDEPFAKWWFPKMGGTPHFQPL